MNKATRSAARGEMAPRKLAGLPMRKWLSPRSFRYSAMPSRRFANTPP
jgi:hypothetical protein